MHQDFSQVLKNILNKLREIFFFFGEKVKRDFIVKEKAILFIMECHYYLFMTPKILC